MSDDVETYDPVHLGPYIMIEHRKRPVYIVAMRQDGKNLHIVVDDVPIDDASERHSGDGA